MPTEGITCYNFILSCPSDIKRFRPTVREVIERFNRHHQRDHIYINLKNWETDSYPKLGPRAQDILNADLGIDDCDALIAIFWTRFGSSTGCYESGTEEEIRKAIGAKKQVFLYFLDATIKPSEIDPDQYGKVRQFKKDYGDHEGLYFIINDENDLSKYLLDHLNGYFNDLPGNQKPIIDHTIPLNASPSKTNFTIGVRSFIRNASGPWEQCDAFLDLTSSFNGRILAAYSWQSLAVDRIEPFFKEHLYPGQDYRLYLDVHLTLAFYFGYLLDSKSGVLAIPYQSTNGSVLWGPEKQNGVSYPPANIQVRSQSGEGDDILVLNISNSNILNDVEAYIRTHHMKVHNIYNVTLKDSGQSSVLDGYHARSIANDIKTSLSNRNVEQKRTIIHIFASAPSAFMFLLGQVSKSFGSISLYEFDLERQNGGTYSHSLDLPI